MKDGTVRRVTYNRLHREFIYQKGIAETNLALANNLRARLTASEMQNVKLQDALVRVTEQNAGLLKLYRELINEKITWAIEKVNLLAR